MRCGDEPVHARSPLRARRALAAWGLVWTTAGTVIFAMAGRTGLSIVCAVLALVTATDLIVIGRHIRQGAHYQPGRNVPPYRPVSGEGTRHR